MCIDISIPTQITYAVFFDILFKVWYLKNIQDFPTNSN